MAEQFAGRWAMDKALSSDLEAILKLQGLSWPLRKMVCLAGVRIEMSVAPGEVDSSRTPDPTETVITVDVTPIGTPGGIGASTEVRKMDWSPFEKIDFLFGLCQERSQFAYAKDGGDKLGIPGKGAGMYPDVEMQTKVGDLRAGRFLRGEINEDGSDSFWDTTGQGGAAGETEKGGKMDRPVWVHTFVRNLQGGGWTAEQIWGFEIIDGERYHTRRVVVANTKGQYVLARLVHKYLGEGTWSKK
ncbi:hypothetical protein BDV10DRAFT_167057 [Aspergillus recurvatus]